MGRYQDWLNADSGLTFAEYLGIDTVCELGADGYRFVNHEKGLWGPHNAKKKDAKEAYKKLLKEGRTGYFLD